MRKSSKIAVSDVAVMERPVSRTAIEAGFYPVEDTISGGYCLDSGLDSPFTVRIENAALRAASFLAAYSDQTSRSIYNPSYDPATPHKIASRETPVDEVPDVLAPYYGKRVELLFLAGRNHLTGKNVEAPLGECAAIEARKIATQHSAGSGMSVIIRCLETGGNIDIVFSAKQKSNRTSTRTVKAEKPVKILTPEEIEEQKIAEWIAAYDAAVLENAKLDREIAKNRKTLADNLKKAMAAAENAAQRAMFERPQGATPKEQNYAWNARNPEKVAEKGVANFGWNQRGQDMVNATRDENGNLTEILVTRLRLCEASLSEGVERLGPAFKIIPANAPLNGWEPVPLKKK